jgi:hypothetical protein
MENSHVIMSTPDNGPVGVRLGHGLTSRNAISAAIAEIAAENACRAGDRLDRFS